MDKQVQKSFEDEQREHYAQLYERIRPQVEQGIADGYQKRQHRKKQLHTYLPIAAVLVVVLCVSIILPITLQQGDNIVRYDNDSLNTELLDTTFKEYVVANKIKSLYPNWYDRVDLYQTIRYFDSNNTTVFISEKVTDRDGNSIEFSCTKKNYFVETLENLWQNKTTEEYIQVNKINIQYISDFTKMYARFEVDGYKYYLQIDNGDMSVLQSTLEDLLK